MELNKWYKGTELPYLDECDWSTRDCVVIYKGYLNKTFYDLGTFHREVGNDTYDFINSNGSYIRLDKIIAYMPIYLPREDDCIQ